MMSPFLMLVGLSFFTEFIVEDSPRPPDSDDRPTVTRRVALTFDDLPGMALAAGQKCDAQELLRVSEAILEPFRREDWPVTAFVTAGRLCEDLGRDDLTRVLSLWIESGAELGNHTFSHLDLNQTNAQEYISDIQRNERILKPLLLGEGLSLRYFRHPYLHTGESQPKREQIQKWLESNGYAIGVVTMDNQEWVYAAIYARAKNLDDEKMMDETRTAYLEHLSASIRYYERLSSLHFGRNIPHVLLLHVNALNADSIEGVLALLTRLGYSFEALDHVLEDDAYKETDHYIGEQGLSWLHRWFPGSPDETESEPRETERFQHLLEIYGRE